MTTGSGTCIDCSGTACDCSGGGVDGGEIGNSASGLKGHSDGVVCRCDRAGLPLSIACTMAGELSRSSGPFPTFILSPAADKVIPVHTWLRLSHTK